MKISLLRHKTIQLTTTIDTVLLMSEEKRRKLLFHISQNFLIFCLTDFKLQIPWACAVVLFHFSQRTKCIAAEIDVINKIWSSVSYTTLK